MKPKKYFGQRHDMPTGRLLCGELRTCIGRVCSRCCCARRVEQASHALGGECSEAVVGRPKHVEQTASSYYFRMLDGCLDAAGELDQEHAEWTPTTEGVQRGFELISVHATASGLQR